MPLTCVLSYHWVILHAFLSMNVSWRCLFRNGIKKKSLQYNLSLFYSSHPVFKNQKCSNHLSSWFVGWNSLCDFFCLDWAIMHFGISLFDQLICPPENNHEQFCIVTLLMKEHLTNHSWQARGIYQSNPPIPFIVGRNEKLIYKVTLTLKLQLSILPRHPSSELLISSIFFLWSFWSLHPLSHHHLKHLRISLWSQPTSF